MKRITAVIAGIGARGEVYGEYALNYPNDIEIVGFADPDTSKKGMFKKSHSIPDDMYFESWEDLLEKPRLADAIIICTQDNMHYEPTIKAIEKGYHVLLEKPMSTNPRECIEMGEAAKKHSRILSVCHVLRYTNFFTTIKKLINEGRIGELVSIQHNENVAYWHQAHSFVRGSWANSKESSPMILAKCSHDMDILLYLVGVDCRSVSSFGSLSHFKEENAPIGAPKRCLDGCPEEDECPYYAPKLYLSGNTGWPTSAVSYDTSYEAVKKALMEGPYGRCVYYCNNDVVDHQIVNMEFVNGVTVAFTMCAFTKDCTRTIKLMGTKGEIRGAMEKNEIEILDFNTGRKDIILLNSSAYGHGGGDFGIMKDFINLVRQDGKREGLTSATASIGSHIIAFAAEKSRLEKRIINIDEYISEIKE